MSGTGSRGEEVTEQEYYDKTAVVWTGGEQSAAVKALGEYSGGLVEGARGDDIWRQKLRNREDS